MKTLTKPVWSEGMYLGPHHFQAQNRYFEDALNFVTSSLWRDACGFAGLQFDPMRCATAHLALTHARGLFADGLAFDLPGSDAAPAAARVPSLFSPVADHLTMHLAVPAVVRDGQNTGHQRQRQCNALYRLRTETCPTRTPASTKSPSRWAARTFNFWLRRSSRIATCVCPVVRLMRDGSGRFEADPTFIPPVHQHQRQSRLDRHAAPPARNPR